MSGFIKIFLLCGRVKPIVSFSPIILDGVLSAIFFIKTEGALKTVSWCVMGFR